MFLPIGDDRKRKGSTWVTFALILSNVVVHILVNYQKLPYEHQQIVLEWGALGERYDAVRTLTAAFLHGAALYLFGWDLLMWVIESKYGLSAGIANSAHLGGLAAGLACGFLLKRLDALHEDPTEEIQGLPMEKPFEIEPPNVIPGARAA